MLNFNTILALFATIKDKSLEYPDFIVLLLTTNSMLDNKS